MIETTKILETDLLDILFEDRNKLYGAYELRKRYGHRMIIAVMSMILCCVLFFFVYSFASGKKKSNDRLDITDLELIKVDPEVKKTEPELPPPPKEKTPPVKTRIYTAPILTADELKPDEKPPQIDDLENAKIGDVNVEGDDYADVVAPPISAGNTGVIVEPKKQDADEDAIRLIVQVESEYPGGIESWRRYLNKNLRYPEPAIENEIQGTVIVQFIVDKAGLVSDVAAISGPMELRDEAVRVIKKSGAWTPAIQNGMKVKSYKKQPITFILDPNR